MSIGIAIQDEKLQQAVELIQKLDDRDKNNYEDAQFFFKEKFDIKLSKRDYFKYRIAKLLFEEFKNSENVYISDALEFINNLSEFLEKPVTHYLVNKILRELGFTVKTKREEFNNYLYRKMYLGAKDKGFTLNQFIDWVKEEYGVDINYRTVYRLQDRYGKFLRKKTKYSNLNWDKISTELEENFPVKIIFISMAQNFIKENYDYSCSYISLRYFLAKYGFKLIKSKRADVDWHRVCDLIDEYFPDREIDLREFSMLLYEKDKLLVSVDSLKLQLRRRGYKFKTKRVSRNWDIIMEEIGDYFSLKNIPVKKAVEFYNNKYETEILYTKMKYKLQEYGFGIEE